LVPWDPSALIALVDDSNDLPILYYFSKESRPYTAVGYSGLHARRLSCLHRPLSLVAVAGGHSDIEVRLCPGYVLLDFYVIQFLRLILTYRVGGQPFEDPESFLTFKRSCLDRWYPLEILCPGTRHETGFGDSLSRDPLCPGKADLEQAVATCLSLPFETEFFLITRAPSQIDSRHGTLDTLVQPRVFFIYLFFFIFIYSLQLYTK